MLNELLHNIVARLAHPSEAAAEELHALVDEAVPPTREGDTPDTGDAPAAGTDTPAKAK